MFGRLTCTRQVNFRGILQDRLLVDYERKSLGVLPLTREKMRIKIVVNRRGFGEINTGKKNSGK